MSEKQASETKGGKDTHIVNVIWCEICKQMICPIKNKKRYDMIKEHINSDDHKDKTKFVNMNVVGFSYSVDTGHHCEHSDGGYISEKMFKVLEKFNDCEVCDHGNFDFGEISKHVNIEISFDEMNFDETPKKWDGEEIEDEGLDEAFQCCECDHPNNCSCPVWNDKTSEYDIK